MSADNERFQRWQKLTIEQLGQAVNLFLTLAVAGLGFTFAVLKEPYFEHTTSQTKIFMILCMISLGLSSFSGLLCTLNRIRDFRATAQRARNNPSAPTKEEVAGLGTITWALFHLQVWAFIGGIGLLVTGLVSVA